MELSEAARIISDNYKKAGNSLCYYLYEECDFHSSAFEEYYEAVFCFARNSIRNEMLSTQIAISYQTILKEIIWHFDPNDVATKDHFPENYTDYLNRLDRAVRAYFEQQPDLLNN
jgi:hypothetical protein